MIRWLNFLRPCHRKMLAGLDPYKQLMAEASQTGRVLKRTDIYGSGPRIDALSRDTQKLVKRYCSGSVIDFGAGCGALQRYLPEGCRYAGMEMNPIAVEMAKARRCYEKWVRR